MSLFVNSPITNVLFENYFSKVYGSRWPQIRQNLAQPEKQILRLNKFAQSQYTQAQLKNHFEVCHFLENCYWKPEGFKLEKNEQGLYPFYIMDPASVLVAQALQVKKGGLVLDLCAAPGGKSLILTEVEPEQLIANEISEGRRERLMRVFHEYVPKEQRLCVTVKGLDGNQYGLRMPNTFDYVLADVPCSGERHLIENTSEFKLWTEKRTKNLAVRQYSLLSSAWFSCKTGGRMVYSTCSISPVENDDVVAKLVKKRKPQVTRLEHLESIEFIEKTEFGYQILPDKCGFGPMYFSVLEKS